MQVSAETPIESKTGLREMTLVKDDRRTIFPAGAVPTPLLIAGIRRSPTAEIQQRSLQFPPAVSAAQLPQEITPETLLLGAWSLLLHRYSGDAEIFLGVQFGDDRLLPLRVEIAPDALLLPWLRQLQDQWKTLWSLDELPPKHDLAELTFECLVVLTKETIAPAAGSPYLLTLAAANDQLQVQFDRSRLDQPTLDRILGHLQMLSEGMVEGMAAGSQRRLVDLPLLTAAEQQQLLGWAQNPVEYPREHCIHRLFEAQARKTPDAIALVLPCEVPRQLTYRQLDDRANLLAAQLQQQGVQRETFVAISMERTIELIVAILGVLKAGGVYVPIDPTYPTDRIAWMLQDTQAPVILTQVHLASQLPNHQAQIICLETDWGADMPTAAFQSDAFQSDAVAATDLAYVNYTSGSTGRPKGVAVPHRGVVRLVFGTDFTPLDRTQAILQLAPIAFDAATFEIWGALLHGGRCVLYPASGVPDPHLLQAIVQNHQITTLFLTTALFNTLIAETPKALMDVQEVLTGGEAISIPHIQQALKQLPQTELIHVYGPTESTTFACAYRIPRQLESHLTTLPIGRPIANTEIYILDTNLQPVPIGVIGELYIGGDGLARGYLNRPDLTKEKFIPNPFSSSRSSRLYKTGDQVRYLPNGNVEFVGRQDNQVKIRGFRIELGEVEAVLRQHESVADAIVIMREDQPGDKRLMAYVTAKDNQPSITSLKTYLSQRLAAYMLPTALMVLDKFPLSPTGKIDRRALPAPAQGTSSHFVAPGTAAEIALAEIWCGVLGLDRVGIEDNFFDLGGTSLLGLQAIARIQKQFGSDLRAVKLYEYPTIRALAQFLSQEADRAIAPPVQESIQARAQRQRATQRRRGR